MSGPCTIPATEEVRVEVLLEKVALTAIYSIAVGVVILLIMAPAWDNGLPVMVKIGIGILILGGIFILVMCGAVAIWI